MSSIRKHRYCRLTLLFLAMSLAVAPPGGIHEASGAITSLDLNDVSLLPSGSPQNFFLNLTIQNNTASAVTITAWEATFEFTPENPATGLTLTGFSNNIAPSAGVGSNPIAPVPIFSMSSVSVIANSIFVTTPVTLPANTTQTLVHLNFQLAANAMTNFYDVAIANAEISFDNFNAELPGLGSGSIATPEPSASLMLFLAAIWSSLRRARRRPMVTLA